MGDPNMGDYFISDVDDGSSDDEDLLVPPVVVPAARPPQRPQPAAPQPQPPAPQQMAPQAPQPFAPAPPLPAAPAPPQPAAQRPQTTVRQASREERLAQALDELMEGGPDIQAAALVSLDGFTMASALPEGMQEDRVGAMSAAILGLGERAAAELGRGHLSQVFIEGDGGYVLLIAAGDRAVLTALAHAESKLGLVLYDMKVAAARIAAVLG